MAATALAVPCRDSDSSVGEGTPTTVLTLLPALVPQALSWLLAAIDLMAMGLGAARRALGAGSSRGNLCCFPTMKYSLAQPQKEGGNQR